MRAGERAELTEMRDAIVGRMHELESSVDHGVLSQEEKTHLLVQEFGPHYQDALKEINELLAQAKHEEPLIDKKLATTLAAILVGALLITGLFGSGITGLVTGSNAQVIKVDATLSDAEAVRVAITERAQITRVRAEQISGDSYTLYLEDANGRHLLYTKTSEQETCTGCNKNLRPPFMITAQTDGEVYVESVAYTEAQ